MIKQKLKEHRSYKFIISGGGTGGHIFPAIAIANALKVRIPDVEILFVGAKDRMEMEKVPQSGYDIEGLWISGFQRAITIRNILVPLKVILSLIKSKKIIRRFKPDAVIGVGGYSSGPVLYVAARLGLPTLIQEQNSYAGITNRLLAKRVNRICVAYDHMDRFFPADKIIKTGNPIRKEVAELNGKSEIGHTKFGLDPNRPTLLVVGGSLGARSVNEAVKAHINEIMKQRVQLIWQVGKLFAEEARKIAETHPNQVRVHTFIKEMDLAYAVADVVISRAGAIAISELTVTKKPTILVPSPNVVEDHQTKNAMALVEQGAALMVKDREAMNRLIPEALQLLTDEDRKEKLSNKMKDIAIADADNRIVDEVLNIV